jgi:Ni,Fe-hydrogenase III component G
MELMGLLKYMKFMEHLELISLDHDHKQKNNEKNIYIVLAVYQKFYELWLILYLFLPNEKQELVSLLAERVKL